MRRFFLWAALVVVAASCSHDSKQAAPGKEANLLLSSSFEGLDGWVGETASLTSEKAHTGQYSIKVDPAIEYSLPFVKQLGRLSATRVSKVRLTAWSLLTSSGKATLVFQISRPVQGDNVFYEKIDLNKVGEWTKVSHVLTLPPVIDPASQVRIYLWRNEATGPVYLDDIALTVEP
jgi:hypothetical protein